MKKLKEIESMLVVELQNNLENVPNLDDHLIYYNDVLGDSSFLLAALLSQLVEKENDWNLERWIDDSLLTEINLTDNKLSIKGVMIWGIENSTEQWTDPFYFEIVFTEDTPNFKEYTFLFCDIDTPEISYEEFNDNRNYWENGFRNWKYILNHQSPARV